MIPSNPYIPQPMGQFFQYVIGYILISIVAITNAQAMSQKFDQDTSTEPYTPSEWHENADPEADASKALNHDDLRLLGFATRMTTVPGIEAKEIEALKEQCGVRLMKNFGDVVKSKKHLLEMQKAHDYAEIYNNIILKECRQRQ